MSEIEFGVDLFGKELIDYGILRGRFIEPPFSILDTKTKLWQDKKRKWISLGIKSEIGRKSGLTFGKGLGITNDDGEEITTSIFDPFLCEILYRWFCPKGGKILDPFAGGSVRGIVANKLGFKYTGIDLSQEQINNNIEQGKIILGDNCPNWICGDSGKKLVTMESTFDFVFSCPPYHDLEVYSNNPDDLSNMNYDNFLKHYALIIKQCIEKLNNNRFACFVVGDLRDKEGFYKQFPQKTSQAFNYFGCKLYNEIILENSVGSASMRVSKQFIASRKNAKTHQNILVFYKGNPQEIRNIFNEV
jgi:DNA modification methylase